MEKFDKKTTYEYCEIKNVMVELEVIRSTAMLPDMVHAEAKLLPVKCNRADRCRRDRVNCLVIEPRGIDPCPGAWNG